MVEIETIETKLKNGIDGISKIEIKDLTGTKDHFEATIVAKAFEGKSRIEQHQLVYKSLGDLMSGPIHALALKTLTPSDE